MASTNLKDVTKAMQHLQLPRVAKKSSSPIPYEITLHIIEALIDMADDASASLTWWLTYDHLTSTKLAVAEVQKDCSCKSPLKDRFALIRLPSQVNRQCRTLAHRRFPRLVMVDNVRGLEKQLYPVFAWVQPERDYFVPFFGSYQLEYAAAERYYKQAVTLPTPAGFLMLLYVQHLWLPNLDFLSGLNRSGLRALFRLPCLQDVIVDTTDKVAKRQVMHPGRFPIEEDTFPWLFVWSRHSAVFNRLWGQFNTTNVRLYAVAGYMKDSGIAIELLPTEAGTHMRYMHPNCTCCDHNDPQYSTIYHGEEK
ncbi:hypothetical protein LZ30DRAFT_81385 [Colletotrichum cereale]|nr:hypothetical protein LZ30DRAFT_81385 [Colletotrichum cereale]